MVWLFRLEDGRYFLVFARSKNEAYKKLPQKGKFCGQHIVNDARMLTSTLKAEVIR